MRKHSRKLSSTSVNFDDVFMNSTSLEMHRNSFIICHSEQFFLGPGTPADRRTLYPICRFLGSPVLLLPSPPARVGCVWLPYSLVSILGALFSDPFRILTMRFSYILAKSRRKTLKLIKLVYISEIFRWFFPPYLKWFQKNWNFSNILNFVKFFFNSISFLVHFWKTFPIIFSLQVFSTHRYGESRFSYRSKNIYLLIELCSIFKKKRRVKALSSLLAGKFRC